MLQAPAALGAGSPAPSVAAARPTQPNPTPRPRPAPARFIGGKRNLRIAKTLDAGLKTYETINVLKYDLRLFFSAGTLIRLEVRGVAGGGQAARARRGPRRRRQPSAEPRTAASPAASTPLARPHAPPPTRPPAHPPTRLQECLAPEEQSDFRIVWRPPTTKLPKQLNLTATAAATAAAAAAGPPAGAKAAGESNKAGGSAPAAGKQVAPAADGDIAERKASVAAAVAASRQGGWALFHYNVLAYLWKVIYNRHVPGEASLPVGKVQRLMPHMSAEEAAAATRVYHTYTNYA
jgi:hypothetical protein